MAAPVRERPNRPARAGRIDPLLLRSVGWSLGAHVLVVALAVVLALYAPEPTRFEPPPGPMVDLVSPRGDSKVFKVGPLATPSGRRAKPATAPPKPEPPKAEPPAPVKAEPPAPEPPKPEPPKVEPKPEPPKPEPPKVEPKPDALPPPKPEPKPEPKKEEPKKPEPKPEPKKEEPKKPEPKPEPKKEEPKKAEPKKEEPKKPDAKKEEPKKTEPAKPDTTKKPEPDAKPVDTKPGPDQKGEPEKPGSVANTQGAGAPGAGKQTEGGQSGDPNGGGGGAGNRSPEFYAYFAYMYSSIKAEWVWSGEADSTLAATVRFSILPDGTIADARITERSRSAVYDDSALNAVRATGSLSPPPASVRADFEDVELVFRAGDLMQP